MLLLKMVPPRVVWRGLVLFFRRRAARKSKNDMHDEAYSSRSMWEYYCCRIGSESKTEQFDLDAQQIMK